jgi:hypothetical protein
MLDMVWSRLPDPIAKTGILDGTTHFNSVDGYSGRAKRLLSR